MKWNVLISCPHLQRTVHRHQDRLAAHGIAIEVPEVEQQLREADLLPIIDRFDGVIAGDDHFSAAVLERAARLKVISKWGIGLDAIDMVAAQRLGIRVTNTPDMFADEVADVVVGYLVLLARRLHCLDRSVRENRWDQIRGVSLRGRTLGVIGVGSIGRAVARRAVIMGMHVLGYDPARIAPDFVRETGLVPVSFEDLLERSDCVSLNCNLHAGNRHMLDANAFERMKNGVWLINTARGGLIDEVALARALQNGTVGGAALDVFETEPLPAGSPLRGFEQCILGTHNGSNTLDAILRVNEQAIANLIEGLQSVAA